MNGKREETPDSRAGPQWELGVLWDSDDFIEHRWPKASGALAGPVRRQEPSAIRPAQTTAGALLEPAT